MIATSKLTNSEILREVSALHNRMRVAGAVRGDKARWNELGREGHKRKILYFATPSKP